MHLGRRILTRLAPRVAPRRAQLSLWDPLSYARLLYWAFLYPQALREYVSDWIPSDHSGRGLAALRQGRRRDLVIQAFIVGVVGALALSVVIGQLFLVTSWTGVLFGMTLGLLFGLASGLALDLATGVALTIVCAIMGGALSGLALGQMAAWERVTPSLVGLFALGAGVGLVISVALAVRSGVIDAWWGILAGWATYGIVVGLGYGALSGLLDVVERVIAAPRALMPALLLRIMAVRSAMGLLRGLAFALGLAIAMARPDSWLLGLLDLWGIIQGRAGVAHVSPLPVPLLHRSLRDTLRRDWATGVRRLDRILRNTMQFVPVIAAVNDVLGAMSGHQALPALRELAEAPYDWNLIRFCSASLPDTSKTQMINECQILPAAWKRRITVRWDTSLRLAAPTQAIAAGFWHLNQCAPLEAAQDFVSLRRYLPPAEEMYRLSRALGAAQSAHDLAAIADLIGREEFAEADSGLPPTNTRLYPAVWRALTLLQRVTLEARMIRAATSRISRSQAHSRALASLSVGRDRLDQIPGMLRGLLGEINAVWTDVLIGVSKDVAETVVPPIALNPYTVGNPVVGRGYIGRDRLARDLAEKWSDDQLPPLVVLHGQRRVGKTSVLHNLSQKLNPNTLLAYTNLAVLGDAPRGAHSLLLALEDSIAVALQQIGRTAPPPDLAGLEAQPYRSFERYLRAIQQTLGDRRLLLALDECDYLEGWINQAAMPADLIQFLRGCAQIDPTLSFILAGLPRLNEIAARYVEPYLGVVPVKVGFLEHAEAIRLLTNPSDQFALEYEPEAAELVWELTAGHPYLVQLFGHLLVERYNARLAQGQRMGATLTLNEAREVAEDPLLYQMGRYYFASVWDQAKYPPAGQQTILRVLARHGKGLDERALAVRTGQDEAPLRAALAALERDDVLVEEQGVWRYAVELMRRWVLR